MAMTAAQRRYSKTEAFRVSQKRYRDRNRKKRTAYNRRWRAENRERLLQARRRYKKANAVQIAQVDTAWRAARRAALYAKFKKQCADCGSRDGAGIMRRLEFHHRDSRTKKFNVGSVATNYSLRTLRLEIAWAT